MRNRMGLGSARCLVLGFFLTLGLVSTALATGLPPGVDEEAVRKALRKRGLSEEAVEAALDETPSKRMPPAGDDGTPIPEPARKLLDGEGAAADGAAAQDTGGSAPLPPETDGGGTPESGGDESEGGDRAEGAQRADASGLRPFGRDFFALAPSTFAPPAYGPIDPDYRIGPGDEIVIDVWGDVIFRLVKIVDREGGVLLPDVGKVALSGQTLASARERIRGQLSRVHSGFATDPPTAFVDVSLGKLRPIKVFVVGEAARPGAYDLSAASTVFHALYYAGGPSLQGTLRDVQVIREGRTVAHLDVYDYLLHGRRTGDIRLENDDTVFVPFRGKTIRLSGEIRRPGIYELTEEEGLAAAVGMAGGVTGKTSLDRAHVNRVVPPAEREQRREDRVVIDVDLGAVLAEETTFALLDLDDVAFLAVPDLTRNNVEIVGQVRIPGTFQWEEGLRVSDLVGRADGLDGDAFLPRALLVRTREDLTRETITLDLGKALTGDPVEDVTLEPWDKLVVYSIWEMQDRETVRISGAIRRPGEYELTEGMSLGELLVRAGGFHEHAHRTEVEVSRVYPDDPDVERIADVFRVAVVPDFLETGDLPDFALENHDAVFVRTKPFWELQRDVAVKGEVLFPGVYTLRSPNERLTSVLERAGGMLETAYPEGFRLIRNEEDVGRVSVDLAEAFRNPGSDQNLVLRAGDVLMIPERPTTVRVSGAVGLPTSLAFRPGKGIGYYVDSVGGYLDTADPGETQIVYSTGRASRVRRFWFDPAVQPGSHIHVPSRGEKQDTDWGAVIKDTTTILASLATTYLVIDRIAQ